MSDLTGAWLGTYWQDDQPTRFELTLLQGGNSLQGSILDDNHLGEANLSGTVAGRQIEFVKKYLAGGGHTVNYLGTVAEDENSMQGTWQIRHFFGAVSGSWEAHRTGDNLTLAIENLLSIADTVR